MAGVSRASCLIPAGPSRWVNRILGSATSTRYFGSKSELFTAATDIDLRLPDLTGVPHDQHGARLVEHFLSRWDANTPEGEVLFILLRSATTDPVAAAGIRNLFARQLLPSLRSIIAIESEVPQRVGLVASQMLGLAFDAIRA